LRIAAAPFWSSLSSLYIDRMQKSTFQRLSFFLVVLLFVFAGCELKNPFEQPLDNQTIGNLPPETHIFLPDSIQAVSDSSVLVVDTIFTGGEMRIDSSYIQMAILGNREQFIPDTTESKKIISWWGDDPDGEVTKYYYKWNFQSAWDSTTAESDTFYLPIRTAYDEFTFEVRAVDDSGMADPTPAKLVFPVFNSPPIIDFVFNSNPSGPTNSTSTTFPTRTFIWTARDPDGNETIVSVEYALINGTVTDTTLPDTLSWNQLGGDADRITLEGLTPGEHTFFVRTKDIAGAYSETIMFPDPTSETEPHTWVVKEPVGDVCLVNDYPLGGVGDQGDNDVELMYRGWLDSVVGTDNYTVWRIGSSLWHPENSLPYAPEDIEATLNYFDKIIWYQYSGQPHYVQADVGIGKYLANGGNMILTAVEIDTSARFIRVDSMYTFNPQGRFFAGEEIESTVDTSLTMTNPFVIGKRLKAIYPRTSASIQFHLNQNGNPSWEGTPPVGYLDDVGNGKLLFLSVPLHQLNGLDNVDNVLDYYLNTEFESP